VALRSAFRNSVSETRINGRAYAAVLRPSVCQLSVVVCL